MRWPRSGCRRLAASPRVELTLRLVAALAILSSPATLAAQTQKTPADLLAEAKALGTTPAARALAQQAADQGLAEAWFWIGYALPGKDDPVPFYARAAELGHGEAFDYLFDRLLFRAAEKADIVQAKKFGDLARRRRLNLGSDTTAMLDTIDRCFEAGVPVIPDADRPHLQSQDDSGNRWLAEIYANGSGVRRNPRLAIALICHGSDVPAELIGMVKVLHESREDATLDPPFRFCEHVTSGMNAGLCAMREAAAAEPKREAEWAELTARWPADHITALARMREAAEAFFEAYVSGEVDQSGTARVAISIDEKTALAEGLLASVREFEAGTLPARLAFATADAELNAVYSALMKRETLEDLGTVTKEGIRGTQRKWLAYRDAWTAFAARRYPQRTADEWKAWITRARAAQLKTLGS